MKRLPRSDSCGAPLLTILLCSYTPVLVRGFGWLTISHVKHQDRMLHVNYQKKRFYIGSVYVQSVSDTQHYS